MPRQNAGSAKTDEELFVAMQAGSEAAMEVLVRRYHASLFGYAFRLVRDYHAAQDLVQEAFYRLCRGSEAVERPGAIRTWLYRVVTNLAADWGKRASTRREVAETYAGFESADGNRAHMTEARAEIIPFETILEQREDRLRVAQALNGLTEQQRIVVYLRFYQELSLEEIACTLEIPLGTVKSRLHYALKGLHVSLTRTMGGGAQDRRKLGSAGEAMERD